MIKITVLDKRTKEKLKTVNKEEATDYLEIETQLYPIGTIENLLKDEKTFALFKGQKYFDLCGASTIWRFELIE